MGHELLNRARELIRDNPKFRGARIVPRPHENRVLIRLKRQPRRRVMDKSSPQLSAEEIVEKIVLEQQLKQLVDDAGRWRAHERAAASDGPPQPAADYQLPDDESRILLQLVGGLALLFKFEPQALRGQAIREIYQGCDRFSIQPNMGTVRTWVRIAVAYVRAPENAKHLPLATLCKLKQTKVKGTLYKLIQGMAADFYRWGRPITHDTLREIQHDLGQLGAKLELADIREVFGKIDDALGQPKPRAN